jgi:preprotein translocase subunit YajC
VRYGEGGTVSRKIILLIIVVLLVYMIIREPTQSASLVQRAFDALTQGAGTLIDAFFRFINALIP